MRRSLPTLVLLFAAFAFSGAQAVSAQWIDVLSYVFPNQSNGNKLAIITNYGNPWRTYSNNGFVGERLPGFFITKGGAEYNPNNGGIWAYGFEQMIYDTNWIYLVRDTSWTSRCQDNNRAAGMLLFTYENGVFRRGGRHFPRWIQNGHTVNTGMKYIQGVERKETGSDNNQEGRWCDADYSGWTSSDVKATLLGGGFVGDRWYSDMLELKIVGGSGAPDTWWFAKDYGLVYFDDGNLNEKSSTIQNPYELTARIPCYPSWCM